MAPAGSPPEVPPLSSFCSLSLGRERNKLAGSRLTLSDMSGFCDDGQHGGHVCVQVPRLQRPGRSSAPCVGHVGCWQCVCGLVAQPRRWACQRQPPWGSSSASASAFRSVLSRSPRTPRENPGQPSWLPGARACLPNPTPSERVIPRSWRRSPRPDPSGPAPRQTPRHRLLRAS